ncbi:MULTISPECIES: relaxase/mobilization nuclease domain-containing protein [Streptomyces]|uniref:Mobilization protein n=1 Tax=Streptomyces venezuelae TaxID=54571 RepID=A0A5P2AKG0_STRVZ|nr:relaxase/mobilization nuclease domain-containing protein [Streptomyces venezuelae]QES18673.1 mobilization protein [Streptomyces venezuelae]
MIPRIQKRGQRTLGLLYYLYGPGKYEEHTDPHLVASWDDNAPDPGRHEAATLKQLQQLLDQPLENIDASERPTRHVWHLSIRNAAEDRLLSDEEWGSIAHRMVAAAGIDDPGRGGVGCRWAAVRHADDHIHIVATLVREDGYKPDLNNDASRVQATARALEVELGLRRLNKGDGTAAQRPTSAERHKAERQGRERTAREELRETVRQSVAGATSEAEFFDRLASAGLLIRKRIAPSGDLLGYKVALPDDRNAQDEPVFYPGARLAPDLSLPRVRERWAAGPLGPEPASAEPSKSPVASGPASARRQTASAAWQAMLIVEGGDDTVAAAHIASAGEVLDALAKTSAAHTRSELCEAAFAFERASRSHVRAERGHDRALRQAARELVHSGPALGRGEDGATTAMAIDMLFFLITAAAHWHARKNHTQQAAAAHQAAAHLRAAYEAAATQPLGALYQRGRHLAHPVRQRQATLLRKTLPELAEQILSEPGWYALAATLNDAEAVGHDRASLLTEAAGRRELTSAESVSDVLVWRLRRSADLPADTTDQVPAGHAEGTSAHRTKGSARGPSGAPRRKK